MASERAAAEEWKPLAAGLINGRLLLVMAPDKLAVMWQEPFPKGFEIKEVPLGVLRTLLATQGLHVVNAADRAVLDAAARMMFSNDGCAIDRIEIDDDGGLPEAELTRRELAR